MSIEQQLKEAEAAPSALFNEISPDDLSNILSEGSEAEAMPHEDTINSEYSEWEEGGAEPVGGQQNPNLGFLSPELVIGIADSMLPALIVWAYGMFTKKRLKPSVFKLTADEKKAISPILKKCLETIELKNENPWTTLTIAVSGIYIGKFFLIDENSYKAESSGPVEPIGEKRGRGRPRKY